MWYSVKVAADSLDIQIVYLQICVICTPIVNDE